MVKIYKIISLLFLFVTFPLFVSAASLSITPSNVSFEVGELVTFRVITHSTSPLNAVSGSVSFPKNLLSVESVSKSESILNFWVTEPNFSNSMGTINFEGVSLSGFNGNTGTILTFRLRALGTGSGKIDFKSGQVLANDGKGTDITESLTGSMFDIKEAQIKTRPLPVVPSIETEPVVEIEKPILSSKMKAPEIFLGSRYGDPAIIGSSDYSSVQVLVRFVSESGTVVFIEGTTDVSGGFTMLVPNSLKNGVYTVSAVAILEHDKNSEQSKEIKVKIGNFWSDIGLESIALFIILVIVIIYQAWRIKTHSPKLITKKVKKEANKAFDMIRKSFSVLREDARERKSSDLKKDLDDAEDLIVKKIKDIESI